jgi:glyoxylase-like metal-dependent hydrolase (beta-lactamase superfamily II)
MNQKNLYFDFSRKFEDFISLGGGHVTAAICAGSPAMLFDPGVSAFGPLYLRELQAHARTTDGLILALSHAHFDHCGAAAYLMRKIPTARLAASCRGAEILKRPNAVELICRLNAEYEKKMAAELAGEDVSFAALDAAFRLADGDSIPLDGGRVCRVLETPGHTRDSLTYYFPDTGIAFIGDAAGGLEHGFIHSPYLVSYEDYIASIEKIKNLAPRAICIPHSGILAGDEVQRYLAEAAAAAVAYKDMIARYLDLYKGDQEKVIERITAEEYDAQPVHLQNRQPFVLNLRAKVAAVAAWLENQNR